MKHANDWEQLDLLDAIAEAEAKMNAPEEVFKRGVKVEKLCSTWQSVVKNNCGVFKQNIHTFPAGSRKDVFVELNMGMLYPYVYGEIDIESVKDGNYGSYSPLSEDYPLIRFNVFDDPWQVECVLTTAINGRICDDRNLSDGARERMLNLVPSVVQKAMISIKNKDIQ